MGYPKKKDLNNRAEWTSTFTNDRSFNDAICQMSVEIRRRCNIKVLEKIISRILSDNPDYDSRNNYDDEIAMEICKHFEAGLGD